MEAPPPRQVSLLDADDQFFIQLLTNDGYPPQNARRATVAGRAICTSLAQGTSLGRTGTGFREATGVSYKESVAFTTDAIAAYYPRPDPTLRGCSPSAVHKQPTADASDTPE